jgi:hypothetical protein
MLSLLWPKINPQMEIASLEAALGRAGLFESG